MSAELWAITMCGGLQVPSISGQVSREVVHLVVANLAFHANDEALVWVSDRTQAKELGKARGSVQLARLCLKREGWLIDTGRRAQRGVKKYRLEIPEAAIKSEITRHPDHSKTDAEQALSGPESGYPSGLDSGVGSGSTSGSGSGSNGQSEKESKRKESESIKAYQKTDPVTERTFIELATANPGMAKLIMSAARHAGISRGDHGFGI